MPDRVSVTFRNQTTPGVYTSQTVYNCWRRGRGLTEADNSAGVYVFQAADWFIPKAMYATQPSPGDVIRAASTTNTLSPYYGLNGDYIISLGGVTEVGALGAWKCATVIPFLQSGLTETVNFYRPNVVVGAGGRVENSGSPTVLAANISVKIQPQDTGVDELYGKLQSPTLGKVFLPLANNSLQLQAHDYLTDASGNIWTVVSNNRINVLGVLESIDVQLTL